MRLRTIGAIVAVVGLLAAVYVGWAIHRLTRAVLVGDKKWPRPWPYPDEWLLRWERRLDGEDRQRAAERGGPPGLKIEGETLAVQVRLAGLGVAALAVSAVDVTPLAI